MRVIIQNSGTNAPGDERVVPMTFNGQFLGTPDELIPLLNQGFPEFGSTAEDCFKGFDFGNNSDCPDKPCLKKECVQVSLIRSLFYFFRKEYDGSIGDFVEPEK